MEDENIDLDAERRKWVLALYERIDVMTHYELLDVPRDADKKAIKRAYYALAAKLHPDRYFGKKLGPYKARMEALFGRLTTAFETLQSREQRAEYDESLGAAPMPSPSPAAPKVVEPPKKAPLDAQQKAALDALKDKLAAGKAKAQEHVRSAERAKAAGDFAAAAQAYRLALVFSPQDAVLKAAYTEVAQKATQLLGESHRKKALLEERHGHWAEAAESWKRALASFPNDGDIQARLAAALARAGR